MSIQNVSGVKPVLTQVPKKEEVEQKITQLDKEIKGGKKKLATALAGLAVIGVAALGVANLVKKGKVPSELSIDEFKKIGNFNKGKAFVEGKPYTGIIDVVNKKGKFQIEYANGVLKSSTKSTKLSEDFINKTQKAGLVSEEYEYIPSLRKIYSEENGTKIIEHQVYTPKCEWVTKSKTAFNDFGVSKRTNTLVGELLDCAVKYPDGSWIASKQEVEALGRGKYHIHTIDKKTGEVLYSEVRDLTK